MMRCVLAIVSMVLLPTAGAVAGSCGEMRTVNGRVTFVDVPCAQVQAPDPWAKEDAAAKAKCGKDFRSLRVGMTIDRFEACNEALSYVSETVDKGGVTEIYRSTFYYIRAQEGRIVSYTRRTH